MQASIPFNKPVIAGKELFYIAQAVTFGNIGGDGFFTEHCARLLEERFGIHKVLMTPSGTAALEMAAMLCDLGPGDEVIMPSYTFVSTANAVARLGARPVFIDICRDTLNMDPDLLEAAVTERTRAVMPVHYAGVGCDMDRITTIARKFDLKVIEDAAQAVNAFVRGQALGSIGHLAAFSFHETKNFTCGEGAPCVSIPQRLWSVPRSSATREPIASNFFVVWWTSTPGWKWVPRMSPARWLALFCMPSSRCSSRSPNAASRCMSFTDTCWNLSPGKGGWNCRTFPQIVKAITTSFTSCSAIAGRATSC